MAHTTALGEDTQAVYVVPLMQLPPGEFQRLVDTFIERRIPSFSGWGRSDVERGILATTYLDTDFNRVARRVALNIQRILFGEDAGALPVNFARDEALSINMETAQAIGVSPPWRIITEANLIRPERRERDRQLTLTSAVQEALSANLTLLAESQSVAADAYDIDTARSRLLPQIEIGLSGRLIDEDRAESSFGSAPQYLVSASATLSQLIFSEPAWADLEIQGHLQLSREQELEQLRLDIALATAIAYLNVLRALTFERIQQENLALTRTNLELAYVRQAVGVSGPTDVYRWESEIATNRQAVIDANSQRNLAEMQLNRLLHRPLEEPFGMEEIGVEDPALMRSAFQIGGYLDDPASFRAFRDFMVPEAIDNAELSSTTPSC